METEIQDAFLKLRHSHILGKVYTKKKVICNDFLILAESFPKELCITDLQGDIQPQVVNVIIIQMPKKSNSRELPYGTWIKKE